MSKQDLTRGRVIIPYGRSGMALVAAHSLGKKGVEVIGCDSVDLTMLSFSHYVGAYFTYPDFDRDEAAFVETMLSWVQHYRPTDSRPYVLMPIFEDNRVLAKHRDRFAPFISVSAPAFEAMSHLHPKDAFARTVKALDVPAPRTWLPENQEELAGLAPDLPYPVLIKPYDQVGGRGIHKVADSEALLARWHENLSKYTQKSLIQETVEGDDYCLTALFDHGTPRATMAYKNVYRFPRETGAGILRETVDDSRFVEAAVKLMEPLAWNGVAEFDFIWDGKDETTPALIEVNTRFWGGLFQSVESGIDFPWLLYKLTVTGSVESAGAAVIGTRTKVPYVWLVSAMSEVVQSDADFEQIQRRGHEALSTIKDGNILLGLKEYAAYLADGFAAVFNFRRRAERLRETLEIGRSARNELLNGEDPYVAFGALFVLASLIRHGELPPEVRY